MKTFIINQDGYEYSDSTNDISGSEYRKLINSLFEDSAYFSLDSYAQSENPNKDSFEEQLTLLLPYVYSSEQFDDKIKQVWYRDYKIPQSQERTCYVCNADTKNFLMQFGCLFDYLWDNESDKYPNMENLVFYRTDNSVVFFSYTHEETCFYYPREKEHSAEILSCGKWKEDKTDKFNKFLLEHDININQLVSYNIFLFQILPLIRFCDADELEIVESYIYALLNDRANLFSSGVQRKDQKGKSILHYAVSAKNDNLLCKLIDEFDFDVNEKDCDGKTPLISAVALRGEHSNDEEFTWIVKSLLERGADKTSRDKNGKTAYDYVIENGYTDIVKLLRS